MNPVTYTDFDHVFWVLNRSMGVSTSNSFQ